MGHNLDIEDSWENSEAHLKKSISLNDNSPDPYFILGLLYVNSNIELAPDAEKLFLKAIKLSAENPNPYIYSGLSFACLYQGKNDEALKAIDQFLELVPNDDFGLNFRNMILKKINKWKILLTI